MCRIKSKDVTIAQSRISNSKFDLLFTVRGYHEFCVEGSSIVEWRV